MKAVLVQEGGGLAYDDFDDPVLDLRQWGGNLKPLDHPLG